jgi:hypothetical protein
MMIELPVKPIWVGLLALPLALFVAIKVAVALTAFNPSEQPVGYVGQDEITNFNLKSGNEILFRGQYEREFWSGTVLAYKADESGNLTGGTVWWTGDAGELMNGQNFDTGRLIATMKDDGTKIPFRFDSLSSTQQGYLTSPDILNYLRGDRSNEIQNSGGTLRQRISVLGDIVHARPLFVADATNATLFVGANDGMLHAINATDDASGGGRERWAYVPSMLLPKMKNLSTNPYVHDYFVDGQINVATIAGGTKRVLVGGLGAGGKGLYALDITGSAGLTAASEADVAAKVKWEVTPTKLNYATPTPSNSYANLGYTYGTVTIAKVDVGGTATDAVIVGNGYNNGGDYGSYLFVINADTGVLIKRLKAGTGTVTSPNGLSTPVAIDEDNDGLVDTVYAGDLNGSMWKFDLTVPSGAGDLSDATTVASTSDAVSLLLATSPAQAITATPGVAVHPEGGYMVTFGTGKAFVDADLADTSVHYAYGIWDGAPPANTVLLTQTLTERAYVNGSVTTRVRSATSNQPVWTSGASNHKGWKVALQMRRPDGTFGPGGERVLGEGSFIENGRFYFTGSNPTISTTIPSTITVVKGEAWLMELDYLTGGSKNLPFLDLSGNVKLDNDDRIKYIASDVIPVTVPPTVVGDPILTSDGVSVGKFISIGVLSQPILVQLVTLNDTLFNQNPDIVVPYPQLNRGVEGGHFDVEIYYGPRVDATAATATIEVGTTGQTSPFPATLGAISVNGVAVFPALTVSDLRNGGDSTTNAETIRSKVINGFTATRTGTRITVKAPLGLNYNGATLTVGAGTSQALVTEVRTAAVAPSPGRVVITDTSRNSSRLSIKCNGTYVTGAPGDIRSPDAGNSTRLNDFFDKVNGRTVNGYTTTCTKGGSPTSSLTCNIAAPGGVSACPGTNGFSLSRIDASSNTGPSGGSGGAVTVPQSGWTNFSTALTTTTFSGAADASVSGNTCSGGTSKCSFRRHTHEYDDIYDRTGVNFLSASDSAYNLSNAVPSLNTEFKVIVQNQYLSPAAKLHIGNPGYLFNVDLGYLAVKNVQTSATLDLATVPTYTRATIGSLAINLPTDAFSNKDWWGGVNGLLPDVRDGLHPTEYGCVVVSDSATRDGNMYQPVVPPATVTASGNGTRGWSSTTTQLTATGVRHNGALTLQIIKATTPNSAIEQSVPGRPEYGYRVKAGSFATYVIAEYAMFHHTKHLGLCYGDAAWTKTPVVDTRTCGATDSTTKKRCAVPESAEAGTDPKIGDLSAGGGTVVSATTTVVGMVTTTTITYSNSQVATITRTENDDGSITIVTIDADLNRTEQRIANTAGGVRTGGDERGLQARTGRISWRELVAP